MKLLLLFKENLNKLQLNDYSITLSKSIYLDFKLFEGDEINLKKLKINIYIYIGKEKNQ